MDNKDNEIWVFLSHSNKDYEKVRRVRNILEEQSFRPLMFFLCCLDSEQEIDYLIKREIDHRTRFIYCESENAKASRWVQEEVKYIKSKDRIFETINLDSPESEIKKQLESFVKKSNIFISYQRANIELAKSIYDRLKKYEFNVWIDYSDIRAGDVFQQSIYNALLNAVNRGYVIALLNESIFKDSWTRKELTIAINQGENPHRSIVPVVPSTLFFDKLSEDFILSSLSKINPINTEGVPSNRISDFIVDEFIERVLPPGAILSHARNFKEGINCVTDLEEANKLFSLYFRIAQKGLEKSPTANIALSLCYEYGYGVKVDYDMALEYINDAISEGLTGFRNDIERIKRKKGEIIDE